MGEDVGSQLPVAAHGSLERRPFASTSSSAPSTGDDNDTTEPLQAAHLDASLPTELVYSLVLNWRGSKQQVTVVESDTVSPSIPVARGGARLYVPSSSLTPRFSTDDRSAT